MIDHSNLYGPVFKGYKAIIGCMHWRFLEIRRDAEVAAQTHWLSNFSRDQALNSLGLGVAPFVR